MKEMKLITRITLLFASVALLIAICLTPEKEEPLFYDDGVVNLNGPWEDHMQLSDYDTDAELTASR